MKFTEEISRAGIDHHSHDERPDAALIALIV